MLNYFYEVEADPHMGHIGNMIQMADAAPFKGFLISNSGTPDEHYIDERTHRTPEGLYLVKPIAESRLFFWYVCPFCQDMHIESKRLLTRDRPVRLANCAYRNQINQYLQFDMAADPLALQQVTDEILSSEWRIMKEYAASRKGPEGW